MLSVENTWKEVRDSGVDTVIVPFSAIEQHGHHLPLGTDWFLADENARRLGERLNAYVLPALAYGCSREHMAFAGTVTLRPTTLAAIFEDVVESLREHGFKNIVVFSSHGGNWILKPILREINFQYPDIIVVWGNGPLADDGEEVPEDIHAGRGETAAMLAVRPDLVKNHESAPASSGIVGQEFNDYVGMDKSTKTGAWGVPAEGTAELGEERIAGNVDHQIRYIEWALRRVEMLRSEGGATDR